MKLRRVVCALICASIVAIFASISAHGIESDEKIQIYLDCEIISGGTVKVSLCTKNNIGFCAGFFVLTYNPSYLSYAFCVAGDIPKAMHFTPTLSDIGRVYVLLDSTQNFYGDAIIANFYFEILDADADTLSFDLFGADEISLVCIEGDRATVIEYDSFGDNVTLSNMPRIVGFQYGDDNIRIVGAGNEKYDILGMKVRAVYPNRGKIESYIYYGYAYKSLNGASKLPECYGADYFFAHTHKTDMDLVCIFITPFGYIDEKIIYGKEKILLFYKGEYI